MVQPAPGDCLDHYRIAAEVATGGMATVFRAVDVRSGREAALKVPHLQAECDPAFFARFQREIEIGKRLDHPGVIKVFDGGNNGRLYLAMEWAKGRPLRQILSEQGQLPFERAIRIALEASMLCLLLRKVKLDEAGGLEMKSNIVWPLKKAGHVEVDSALTGLWLA